jgi:hypothetical protein
VEDWHIVHEDLPVPVDAPYRVKLTLNYVKRVGDIQENQEPYGGLTPALNGMDVVIVDLETGLTMDSRTLSTVAGAGGQNGNIDYETGTIHFAPMVQWSQPPDGRLGPAESIAGKTLRIFYRTEDDFGLQVQKAFTAYLRSMFPQMVTPGQYGQLSGTPAYHGILVFPPSDQNQTVQIDYSFVDTQLNRRFAVSGELQPIQDPRDALSDPVKALNLGWIRLNNADRAVPGSIQIQSVRGTSVRARVAWREGNRWRRVENSTYLTRERT